MIEMVITDPDELKTSINVISNIVSEIRINVDSEKLEITAMSRDHVLLVHYLLESTYFNIYEVDEETSLQVDAEELDKVLQRAGRDDVLTITSTGGYLTIEIEGVTKKKYKIKLIDMDEKEYSLPPDDEREEVIIPSDVLRETVKDMKTFTNTTRLTLTPEKIIFEAPGEFIESRIEYIHDSREIGGMSRSKYSLEQIEKMMKAYKLSEEALLSFGEETPLRLTYEYTYGDGELDFVLAPIIDDTDDL